MISRIKNALLMICLLLPCYATSPAWSTPAWPQAPQAARGSPNLVLILLDDVGFGAAATFGGPAATPALDKLAEQGLRYNRFHVTPMCSPTRASLLSGRNHHRAAFGAITEFSNINPSYNAYWPKSVASLPDILRRNGYSTAAFGKWHNTPTMETSPVGPFDRWPTGLGFEYFYGFHGGEVSQWEPPLYRNTTPVEPDKSPSAGYHITTDLVDDAVRWVHTHQSVVPGKPYFLYFAAGATHGPHHVPQEWIDKYKGRFDQGWDKLREEIFVRQKRQGVVPSDADLTPRPKELPAWDSLSADQRRLYARQAEVYAAFLAQTDHEIGRLLDSIRQAPDDNTLVFYIVGDNGASMEGGIDGTDNQLGESLSGLSTNVARQLPNIDKLGGPERDNHVAAAWAWAMNTPFQWAKTTTHLGGTRNPLVVSWPARIKDKGAVRSQFTHVNDIAPTIYELLGIRFPKAVDGVNQEPIDGSSFAATIGASGASSSHRVQYFEQLGNRAIYKDGWIAVALHGIVIPSGAETDDNHDFELDKWELYNLDEDFSQAHDLSGKYPAKLAELKKLFDAEAKKNNVFPMINGKSTAMKSMQDKSRPALTDGNRKEYLYHGNTLRLPVYAAPILLGSHRITAEFDMPGAETSGVILANGGRIGGFALYVKDGRLVYEHNFFGRGRSLITSSLPLPTGRVKIGFEFERHDRQKWGGGTGRLTINGEAAGEGEIAHVGLASFIDTFDIGVDRGSPVSEVYRSPAAFTGRIGEVRIHLD